MTARLQPPVDTVIETREDAIRILLLEYPDFFNSRWSAVPRLLTDQDGAAVIDEEVCRGDNLPYTVTGILDGFTEDPNFSMHPRVEGAPSEGIDDLEALADEPLKHYVWVEGCGMPSKSHDTRENAVTEALRLSQKERKMAIVCTDIIKPVIRAEIVELEKG